MLHIKYIRENIDKVKKATADKQMDLSVVDKVLELDEKRRKLIGEIEVLRAERNKIADEIGKAKGKPSMKLIKQGKEVKAKLKDLEPKLEKLDKEYTKTLWAIPNVVDKGVHFGKDDSENKVIRKWGEPKKFTFKIRDHMDIGEMHDIIDTETSAKVSGTRFNYLKGDAVLLQFAIIQFTLATLTNEKIIGEIAKKTGNKYSTPFVPVVPPVIAKAEIMKKMDRFDPIEDRYYLKEDDSLLVGSAEHTLGPMHMNEILIEKDLPLRYIGYSTAFRREAGTYGKDTKGILRRHQFDKLEMETFCLPEDGKAEQDLIVGIQEYLVQSLGLPYQVVMICTGDMGKPDYRQIDIETWMPGQGKYRETHTSDYMTDYQSRRLNIRYKGKKDAKGYVHMNDATAFAIGRILIAILENYQQKDGSVLIPEVLQKWMGKEKITKN